MKKLTISILIILLSQISFTQANPTNTLNSPNYFGNNTIVETNNNCSKNYSKTSSLLFDNLLLSTEKRNIFIKTKDGNEANTATAIINFVNVSGEIVQGPYNITEGKIFEIELKEPYLEIKIIEISDDAVLEHWFRHD